MTGKRRATDIALVGDAIAALKPYEPGKPIEEVERELGVKDALKLASNENVWGPSPAALTAARGTLDKLWLYPDSASHALRTAIAAHHGVALDEVVVGNGSNELIGMIVRCFVRPGESVASSAGSFVAYRICARAHGHRFLETPLSPELGYDLDALAAAIEPTTRVIFIANPNNPTGTMVSADALDTFIARVHGSRDWGEAGPPLVVLDEAYVDFVDRRDAPDGLALVRRWPHVVVLRTFSKAYGLAALRVGYALCEADIADYLNRVRDPFNLNLPGQVAAQAALADKAWLGHVVAETIASRAMLTRGLEAMGLAVVPSQANFVLVDVKRNAREVNDGLMRRGVIARPVGPSGLPFHLRITVGRSADNEKLLAALKDVLA